MTPYVTYEDDALLMLLQQGDESAFTEIYCRYWKQLYAAAYKIVDDEAVCNDTVQDIFVWLWENKKKCSIRSLKSYLCTAVKFKMLNIIRQGKIRDNVFKNYKEQENGAALENNLPEVKELQQMISDFMAALPGQAARIFYLSRQEHLTHKEIAHQLNLSEKTVKNQINLSLRKFRITLAKHFSVFMQLFF